MPAAEMRRCALSWRHTGPAGVGAYARALDARSTDAALRKGRFRKLLLCALLALGMAACGSDGGAPGLQDACAYVSTVDGSFPGTLPGGFSSYSIVGNPSKGNLTLTNPLSGQFIYEPNPAQRGDAPLLEDSFLFQGHRNDGSSNVASFRLVYVPRIMPLGDSITWGGPGGDPCPLSHVGYRKPLYDSLVAGGYAVDFVGTLRSGQSAGLADPDHEGHGAWSADQLVDGRGASECTGGGNLDQWLDDTRPDVVLLHAGTNDLNAGGGTSDPAVEAQDIGRILGAINMWEAGAGNWPLQVLVARIIINRERGEADTNLFNDTVFHEFVEPAIRAGDEVFWVDQESALNDFDRDYIDLLHPSPTGYQRMADVWLQTLTGILPKCP